MCDCECFTVFLSTPSYGFSVCLSVRLLCVVSFDWFVLISRSSCLRRFLKSHCVFHFLWSRPVHIPYLRSHALSLSPPHLPQAVVALRQSLSSFNTALLANRTAAAAQQQHVDSHLLAAVSSLQTDTVTRQSERAALARQSAAAESDRLSTILSGMLSSHHIADTAFVTRLWSATAERKDSLAKHVDAVHHSLDTIRSASNLLSEGSSLSLSGAVSTLDQFLAQTRVSIQQHQQETAAKIAHLLAEQAAQQEQMLVENVTRAMTAVQLALNRTPLSLLFLLSFRVCSSVSPSF